MSDNKNTGIKKGMMLGDILSGIPVSESNIPGREQIEYINLLHIKENPDNFYSMDGIDELAANIATVGLQQPIRVRKADGSKIDYRIVSGHRRMAAIRELAKEAPDEWEAAPCIVETDNASPELQELRLIFANSGTRKLTSADTAKQVERVQELLYKLKEQGYNFPGKMRQYVAEACRISESKIARLSAIRSGLCPQYLVAWQKGEINEAVAYCLSQMDVAMQSRIFLAVKTKLPYCHTLVYWKNTIERTGVTYEAMKVKPPKGCAAKDHVCDQARRHLAHDIAGCNYCGETRCCMDCSEGGKHRKGYGAICPQICAGARKAYEERTDAEEAREAEEKAAESKKRAADRVTYAKRLLRAANAAHVSGKTEIKLGYVSGSVGTLQEDVAGSGRVIDIRPYYVADVVKNARALQCSADYLLELTDELHGAAPVSVWHSGTERPEKSCDVVVDFIMDEGDQYRMLAVWNGSTFCFRHGGVTIDMEPIRWMVIPEVE